MSEIYAISPVGSDPSFSAKRSVLEDCARRFGFRVLFPMDALRQKLDSAPHVREAMAQMATAQLVIADLSFERPSCYFELGVAEASGARIAVISRLGTDIHQTSLRDSVEWYSDMDHYRQLITSLLKDLKPAVSLR